MSEHGTGPAGEQPNKATAVTHAVHRPGQGHAGGGAQIAEVSGDMADRFTNPGLPPHVPRSADLGDSGARRAERQVATLFGISMVATVIFLVAYFAVDQNTYQFIPGIGQANLSNIVLGTSLGVSLLCIGIGAVHWAKTLMPDTEVAEDRHPQRSSDQARRDAVETAAAGGKASQLGRRPLIKYTLGGALGLFALPLLVQLSGSLGPLPHADLATTFWRKGMRLMRDPEMTPIKLSDVTLGSVFHVMPEGIDQSAHVLEEKAKAAVILMSLPPEAIKVPKERAWGVNGVVAYSKICTHVGCPVGLYEHRTHHLLCPCHQSTFDVANDAAVIFGPAHRPLPQLQITVDAQGYLVAAAPFQQPVGPSYWER